MPDNTLAPFISTDDLSDYLGRDVTTDNGAVIAVDAACNIIRMLADQTFDQVVGTVVLDGTGTDCLLLPEIPVNSAGTVIESGTTLVEGEDYVLADDRKLIRTNGTAYTTITSGYTPTWQTGRQNVTVTYDHGYAGTIPTDVRMIALQLAERIAVQGIAQSETVAGQSITYASPAMDLTPGEKLILSRYRTR